MDPTLRQQFLDLIRIQTGLLVREQDWPDLTRMIAEHARDLGIGSTQAYFEMLKGNGTGADVTGCRHVHQAWQALYDELTTGETYLFRDRDQLQTLTDTILPTLIQHQRAADAAQPSLRIWSAGCSTGEELYSLAIMVEDLIPERSQWQIQLFGTDLSTAAITQAQQGIYRAWSFRQTDDTLQQRYFHPQENRWQILERFRNQVTFAQGNLLTDPIPTTQALDLIICRNVFIYFDSAAIASVLDKFWHALRPGGYLLTGHAELYNQDLSAFKTIDFPASVIYQRPPSSAPQVSPLPAQPLIKAKLWGKTHPHRDTATISNAASLPTPSAPRPISPLSNHSLPQPSLTAHPNPQIALHIHYRQALADAERGAWEAAIHGCQAALEIDATAVLPLYLWAQIAQQQQDFKQAKTLLKKILLLQPTAIAAYTHLGEIHRLQGQHDRAQKMFRTAQELLAPLPAETLIEGSNSETAGQLLQRLRQLIATATVFDHSPQESNVTIFT